SPRQAGCRLLLPQSRDRSDGHGISVHPPVQEPVPMSAPSDSPGSPRHVPVLPAEVLDALAPSPGQTLVDATVGAGGHSGLLAGRLLPGGRLIGLDQDAAMLELARPRLDGLPVTLVQANFDRLREVLDELGIAAVDGVLADLGLCSDQLDAAARGFSFQAS